MIKVTINGEVKLYNEGIPLEQIVNEYQPRYDHLIVLVTINGKIRELHKTLTTDCELAFITRSDRIGHKTYVRSAIMLLMTAIHNLYGHQSAEKVKVSFTIGHGYYCAVGSELALTDEKVTAIKAEMRALVERNLTIAKQSYPIAEAMELFRRNQMEEKEKLFRYRRGSSVNIYCLDGYNDYYYGFMVPSTGYLHAFELLFYQNGMMLLLPEADQP
ncbi:MAG: nucleoside kinase, partial [Lachnospiraceae bacterium]|nr:nucleoside kinase [Lachnospiraceae bacterium]